MVQEQGANSNEVAGFWTSPHRFSDNFQSLHCGQFSETRLPLTFKMASQSLEGVPNIEEVFEIDAKDVVKVREIGRGTPSFQFPITLYQAHFMPAHAWNCVLGNSNRILERVSRFSTLIESWKFD